MNKLINSWGIENPSEFYVGIGVCVGIYYLAICASIFVLSTFCFKPTPSPKECNQSIYAFLCSLIISLLFFISFIIIACYNPSEMPSWGNNVLGICAVLILIATIALNTFVVKSWKAYMHPASINENPYFRPLTYRLPIIVLGLILSLWRLFDLH